MDEDVFREELFAKKTRQNSYRSRDLIEPWMDEPQAIPVHLLSTHSQKYQKQHFKIRRHASVDIFPKSLLHSPKKQQRPSKMLPRMDVGNFTVKTKQTLPALKFAKKVREVSASPPTINIARELAIERKLYMMKNKQFGSRPRLSTIRGVVQSKNYGYRY